MKVHIVIHIKGLILSAVAFLRNLTLSSLLSDFDHSGLWMLLMQRLPVYTAFVLVHK